MHADEHGTDTGFRLAPNVRQKFLVVGAGVAGLQVARQLLKLNRQVLVIEASSAIGGVWSANYVGYGLQVPWRLYQFPDFLWPKHLQPADEFPTGEAVLGYINAYAEHFGLRRHIRFNCKLLRLRCSPDNRTWEALYCDTVQEKFFKVTVDYVIICTGIYSNPYIPSYTGTENFAGTQLHARDFEDLSMVRGRRVLIVGAGKTALDCVSGLVASRTAASVTLLYRQAHWPLPRRVLGVSIRNLFFNRTVTAMLPPYYTAGRAEHAMAVAAAPLKRLFWATLECAIKRKFKITEKLRPRVGLPADIFYGGQVLDDRMDELMECEELATVKGEINCFVRNGVILQDGTFLPADLVLYCTGYEKTYDFFDSDVRIRLGLQKDGLYLYRSCVAPHVPHLAFVGSEISTYNNILTHGLQALWLAHVLTGRVQLPSPADMVADIRAQQRWRRKVMPPQRTRGAVMMLYGIQYHDQLLLDMGQKPHRKGANLLGECFGAYSAEDYAPVVKQLGEALVAAQRAQEQLNRAASGSVSRPGAVLSQAAQHMAARAASAPGTEAAAAAASNAPAVAAVPSERSSPGAANAAAYHSRRAAAARAFGMDDMAAVTTDLSDATTTTTSAFTWLEALHRSDGGASPEPGSGLVGGPARPCAGPGGWRGGSGGGGSWQMMPSGAPTWTPSASASVSGTVTTGREDRTTPSMGGMRWSASSPRSSILGGIYHSGTTLRSDPRTSAGTTASVVAAAALRQQPSIGAASAADVDVASNATGAAAEACSSSATLPGYGKTSWDSNSARLMHARGSAGEAHAGASGPRFRPVSGAFWAKGVGRRKQGPSPDQPSLAEELEAGMVEHPQLHEGASGGEEMAAGDRLPSETSPSPEVTIEVEPRAHSVQSPQGALDLFPSQSASREASLSSKPGHPLLQPMGLGCRVGLSPAGAEMQCSPRAAEPLPSGCNVEEGYRKGTRSSGEGEGGQRPTIQTSASNTHMDNGEGSSALVYAGESIVGQLGGCACELPLLLVSPRNAHADTGLVSTSTQAPCSRAHSCPIGACSSGVWTAPPDSGSSRHGCSSRQGNDAAGPMRVGAGSDGGAPSADFAKAGAAAQEEPQGHLSSSRGAVHDGATEAASLSPQAPSNSQTASGAAPAATRFRGEGRPLLPPTVSMPAPVIPASVAASGTPFRPRIGSPRRASLLSAASAAHAEFLRGAGSSGGIHAAAPVSSTTAGVSPASGSESAASSPGASLSLWCVPPQHQPLAGDLARRLARVRLSYCEMSPQGSAAGASGGTSAGGDAGAGAGAGYAAAAVAASGGSAGSLRLKPMRVTGVLAEAAAWPSLK